MPTTRANGFKRGSAQRSARSEEKWAAAGLAVSHRRSGMTPFPNTERNGWYSANRTPLVEGYVSETMNGGRSPR